MKRVTAVVNRRREPDEVAIPEIAIRAHCAECMGFQPALVDGCSAPECWLYPLRNGMNYGKIPPNEIKGSVKRLTQTARPGGEAVRQRVPISGEKA
jgi:hypothetical protein